MSNTDTQNMLYSHVANVRDNLDEFSDQIESGRYGHAELVVALDHLFGDPWVEELTSHLDIDRAELDGDLGFDHDALDDELDSLGYYIEAGNVLEWCDADEPVDHEGSRLSEYGLEFVAEIGRPFTYVISTGGPHIEITSDGGRDIHLVGYWAGCDPVIMRGHGITTVMEYLVGYYVDP